MKERAAVKKARTRREEKRARQRIRRSIFQKWKDGLYIALKCEWTRALIPNLDEWMSRIHGQLNFHLNQVWNGQYCFNGYLNRIGKAKDSACTYYEGRNDDPWHTLFKCEAWRCEREEMF